MDEDGNQEMVILSYWFSYPEAKIVATKGRNQRKPCYGRNWRAWCRSFRWPMLHQRWDMDLNDFLECHS